MKKTLSIVLILGFIGVAGILIAQDLQKQAFDDFNGFVKRVEDVKSQTVRIHHLIGEIQELKTEILDDVERKKALKALVDLHPDYDLVEIGQTITKLGTLKTWLENQGFVEVEIIE